MKPKIVKRFEFFCDQQRFGGSSPPRFTTSHCNCAKFNQLIFPSRAFSRNLRIKPCHLLQGSPMRSTDRVGVGVEGRLDVRVTQQRLHG